MEGPKGVVSLESKNSEEKSKNSEEKWASFVGNIINNDFKCCVCTEVLMKAASLNCNHYFCNDCINEWLQNRDDCPVCRKVAGQKPTLAPAFDSLIEKYFALQPITVREARTRLVEERTALSRGDASQGKEATLRRLVGLLLSSEEYMDCQDLLREVFGVNFEGKEFSADLLEQRFKEASRFLCRLDAFHSSLALFLITVRLSLVRGRRLRRVFTFDDEIFSLQNILPSMQSHFLSKVTPLIPSGDGNRADGQQGSTEST